MKILKLMFLSVVTAVAILFLHASVVPAEGDFDLNACYASCGCAHGVLYACMECKAECDRKGWKAFDREMDDVADDSRTSRGSSKSQK